MNEQAHFKAFKGKHRMSVATNIGSLTTSNGNGHKMQETAHLPETLPWRMRVKESLRRFGLRWETLIVAGKTIEKGFVISPQIAGIILVAIIGMAGWAYKTSTADSRETRDAIIRMETVINERTRTISEQQAEFKRELTTEKNVAQLQREKADRERWAMKFALQQKGIQIAE